MTKSIDGLVPIYIHPLTKKWLRELAEDEKLVTYNEIIEVLMMTRKHAKDFANSVDSIRRHQITHPPGYKIRENPELAEKIAGRGLIAGDKK